MTMTTTTIDTFSSSSSPAAGVTTLESTYDIFLVSLRSVGTSIAMAFVGIYLHRKGFVNNDGKRTLARISQQVTFPLYLFTKILECKQDWSNTSCPPLTQTLYQTWYLIIWPIVVVGTGYLVGCSILHWTGIDKTPRQLYNTVLASCMFGNSSGLAITLLTQIHASFPEKSYLGGNGVDPTILLSVYLLLFEILQWGIGGYMLSSSTITSTLTKTTIKSADDEYDDDDDQWMRSHSWSRTASISDASLSTKVDDGGGDDDDDDKNNSNISKSNNNIGEVSTRQAMDDEDQNKDTTRVVADISIRTPILGNRRRKRPTTDYPGDDDHAVVAARATEAHHRQQQQQQQQGIVLHNYHDGEIDVGNVGCHIDPCHHSSDEEHSMHEQQSQEEGSSILLSASQIERQQQLWVQNDLITDIDGMLYTEQSPLVVTPQPAGLLLSSSNHYNNSPLDPIIMSPNGVDPSLDHMENTWYEAIAEIVQLSKALIDHALLQPPVLAVIFGFLVAIIPKLRGMFVDIVDRCDNAPLEWIYNGLFSIGQACVPINMLLLGCNLSAICCTFSITTTATTGSTTKTTSSSSKDDNDQSVVAAIIKDIKNSRNNNNDELPIKTVIGICIGKMIIIPIISIIFCWLCKTMNWIYIDNQIESAIYLTMMLVCLTPTSNHIMVMIELSGYKEAIKGLAICIGLQYIVAPIILSITLTIAIGIASNWQ